MLTFFFFIFSKWIDTKSWGRSSLNGIQLQNMKFQEIDDSYPLGSPQGPLNGPRMTKKAKNHQNHEFFFAFSPLRMLKMHILCLDTLIKWWGTQIKLQGPLEPPGVPSGAPKWPPNGQKNKKITFFFSFKIVRYVGFMSRYPHLVLGYTNED